MPLYTCCFCVTGFCCCRCSELSTLPFRRFYFLAASSRCEEFASEEIERGILAGYPSLPHRLAGAWGPFWSIYVLSMLRVHTAERKENDVVAPKRVYLISSPHVPMPQKTVHTPLLTFCFSSDHFSKAYLPPTRYRSSGE